MLDDSGESALQNYVNLGGNFVGIHAASDAQRNSTFYQNEIGLSLSLSSLTRHVLKVYNLGAHFDYHPAIQNAVSRHYGPRCIYFCRHLTFHFPFSDCGRYWTIESKHEHAA